MMYLTKNIVFSFLLLIIVCNLSGQTVADRLRNGSNNPNVPTVKNFSDDWIANLDKRGDPIVYTRENSANFDFIGMPVGGIAAGQLYLGGDGKLWFWDIFNTNNKIGDYKGEEAYEFPYRRSEGAVKGVNIVDQGFAIRVNGKLKTLDKDGFKDIAFIGQYPIGKVSYEDKDFPVKIGLEAFSPFIPLNVENSSFPATIFSYTITNISDDIQSVEFGGWLENAVAIKTRENNYSNVTAVNNRTGFQDNIGLKFTASDAVGSLPACPDGGSMSLYLIRNVGNINTNYKTLDDLFVSNNVDKVESNFKNNGIIKGSLSTSFTLNPGEKKEINFLLTWFFPNTQIDRGGRRQYVTRFSSSDDVAKKIILDFDNLAETTRKWNKTWYDSTLPYWFLDRTFLNTSILATQTSFLFEDGRFYGFEGGLQGEGTCTHVWGYVQAMGRLFPQLEIALREKTDFVPYPDGGFYPATGIINFRGRTAMGEGWGNGLAVDGQSGIILRSYLTHQMMPDESFLKRNYNNIKQTMNGLIEARDKDLDGILTGAQHNTLDADWYGKIPWLSLYYTAALRAMAEMADDMSDSEYAKFCRNTADKGRAFIEEKLFNGEYFFQEADPQHPNSPGVYNGCEYSQLLGQSWAYQVGLGDIIDPDKVTIALNSLWRYNFSSDVGPFRKKNPTGRWYAMPGEGGLIACTWPKGGSEVLDKGDPRFAAYNNECQNGYEYAATSLMMWHGMPEKALAHTWYMNNERYHGSKRNPWCEVEWGIHYSRSMASYGLFTAACGFKYNGPKEQIGFNPKIQSSNFKAAFIAAEGWGTYIQSQTKGQNSYELKVEYGKLKVKEISVPTEIKGEIRSLEIKFNDKIIKNNFVKMNNEVVVKLDELVIKAGESLIINYKM